MVYLKIMTSFISRIPLSGGRWLGWAAAAVLSASSAGGQIILDLHDPPGTHGAVKTDGVAWFQDSHSSHANAANKRFLCLQSKTTDDVAYGFNVLDPNDAGLNPPEMKDYIKQTASLTLDQVPEAYGFRVFLFDGNQQQSGGSFDHVDIVELEVYLANTADIVDLDVLRGTTIQAGITSNLVYSLDKPMQDYTVRVEGITGGGDADMHFFIPDDLFQAARVDAGDESANFVYLFARHENDNDGFEHYLADLAYAYVNPVPEPSRAVMILGGLLGASLVRRRGRARPVA